VNGPSLSHTTITMASDPDGNNGPESYNYDAVGNRLTVNSTIPSLSGGMTYTYDANDRLTTDTSDKDGNTTASGGVTNTYDFENHLLKHSTTVTMVYDGDGNRVRETVGSTTINYLIDDLNPTGYSQVLDERVSGSVTRTYAYGLQRISENQLVGSTWTPSFYGYDGHGNVRFLANTAGTLTDSYTFDAFGAPIASTGTTPNAYLYSGERFDSNLNLYQLRARFYNMLTGRFETMGPLAGRVADPRTLHKYLYTAGNPINLIDPTGRDLEEGQILGEVKEEVETEVYENKFTCIEDAFEQLEDLEFALSYLPEDYGASSAKSLKALLNCAKKGL
jgi:RHS repeat-associated protein